MDTTSPRDPQGDTLNPEGAALAAELHDLETELLERYRRLLVDQHNPLGIEQEAWTTCRQQAQHIIAECMHSLRHGTQPLLSRQLLQKTRRLGGARISQGIAPVHSVRAGALLFQVVMEALSDAVVRHPGAAHQLMKALMSLQTAITRRLEEGAGGFDLFLLDVVRDAEQQGRHGMAREIHDRIGSVASLALRQLELYELTQGLTPAADARLSSLKQAILETLYTTRDIVTELRTRTNTTRSLQLALQAFVSAMALDEPVVEIRVTDPEDLLPRSLGDDLFLMLRECLRNAIAHAAATRVVIEVHVGSEGVRATVRDDGTGFSPGKSAGNGLASLTERTGLLGGRLTIDSAPGKGTSVALTVPVDEHDKENHGQPYGYGPAAGA
ncbi:ATP-binding protein [Streptomyces sp. Q6]|uniref:ATP-binding protein n=1 Tax=Streptomyces citrinus TaxID=3118173 RepID=A0ACD5AHC3_9ACTN